VRVGVVIVVVVVVAAAPLVAVGALVVVVLCAAAGPAALAPRAAHARELHLALERARLAPLGELFGRELAARRAWCGGGACRRAGGPGDGPEGGEAVGGLGDAELGCVFIWGFRVL
jgi:hypothetical protein